MVSKTSLNGSVANFSSDLIAAGAIYASVRLAKGLEIIAAHSSNERLARVYAESDYAKSCHLHAAGPQLLGTKNSSIMFWDLIHPTNEISLYLNELRKSEGIYHGVSICQVSPNGVVQIIALAGREGDLHFEMSVLQNKQEILKKFQFMVCSKMDT